jgi:hypothetical protein
VRSRALFSLAPCACVQWEPFAPGVAVNDSAMSQHWPRSQSFSTTLYRYSIFPLEPEVTLTDLFTVVAYADAASFLTNISVPAPISTDVNGEAFPRELRTKGL